MPKFIKLHYADGKDEIWFNTAHIVSIDDFDGGSLIVLENWGDVSFHAQESPEQIINIVQPVSFFSPQELYKVRMEHRRQRITATIP